MLCGFFKKIVIVNMYVYMSACLCIYHMHAHSLEGQKRTSDLMAPELKTIVNHLIRVLGTESGSATRAANIRNHWVNASASKMSFTSFVSVCHTEGVHFLSIKMTCAMQNMPFVPPSVILQLRAELQLWVISHLSKMKIFYFVTGYLTLCYCVKQGILSLSSKIECAPSSAELLSTLPVLLSPAPDMKGISVLPLVCYIT